MKRFFLNNGSTVNALGLTLLLCLLPATAGASLPALVDLDGNPASLEATVKPKELVVFWATWCDECRNHLAKELPALGQRTDVAVVTVNTDRDDDRVRDFVKKEGIALPVYRDPASALRRGLKIFSVPYWAVYRRDPASHELQLVKAQAAFDMPEILEALK